MEKVEGGKHICRASQRCFASSDLGGARKWENECARTIGIDFPRLSQPQSRSRIQRGPRSVCVESLLSCVQPSLRVSLYLMLTSKPDLETVRIYCTEIELGRSPFITLTSLTIELSDNGIPLQTLLSPSTLPSLRVLAFTQADEEDFAGMALLPPFLSLFEQLDAFQLEASAMTSIANVRIRHLLDKTLFEGGSAALCDYSRIYHFIHHLRIPIGALHSKLTDHFMKTDDLPLRSLYLDSSLRHYSVEQATNQQHRILLSACRARQIDVVYEEQAKEDFFDSVVSHEFWRRQRERKRSKAAGSI